MTIKGTNAQIAKDNVTTTTTKIATTLIVALAISSGCTPPASPCGSCRQVLSELIPFDAPIYLVNTQGEQIVTNVKELLPLAFTEESL